MLVVKVELWPWGNEERKREIARTYIYNTGEGTVDRGEYKARVCRNKYKDDKPYKAPSKELIREGKGAVRSGVFMPNGAKPKQVQRCTLCGSTEHKSNRCTVYPDHKDQP